ncbi:MAG TPA: glycosyltransferase family 2 protein [Gemmatimonadetes bacterium]|jgi:glycosyltransferase involved in cell wall biosynthesis|nr:glycosyltransferase family 2 protein [Gemmatimonadota bacterium]
MDGQASETILVTDLTEDSRKNFTLVIPAYNESPVMTDLIAELRTSFTRHQLTGEIILIDDGSTDDTRQLARTLTDDWPLVRVLHHRKNLGKTEAIITAFQASTRDNMIIFDADLQHSPEEIPRFLRELQKGSDIVTGMKIGDYQKPFVSTMYNWLSKKIFRVPVSDLNSMKAFKTRILSGMHLRHDWHRFFVVLAYHRGYSVSEIPIRLFPRKAGVSKYSSPLRIVPAIIDMMSVWFLLLFSRKPLILFGFTGMLMIILGIFVGVLAFYFRFALDTGFRPLLYLVMLLETVGFLMLGFGLIAEMIAQVREEFHESRRQQL